MKMKVIKTKGTEKARVMEGMTMMAQMKAVEKMKKMA